VVVREILQAHGREEKLLISPFAPGGDGYSLKKSNSWKKGKEYKEKGGRAP